MIHYTGFGITVGVLPLTPAFRFPGWRAITRGTLRDILTPRTPIVYPALPLPTSRITTPNTPTLLPTILRFTHNPTRATDATSQSQLTFTQSARSLSTSSHSPPTLTLFYLAHSLHRAAYAHRTHHHLSRLSSTAIAKHVRESVQVAHLVVFYTQNLTFMAIYEG